MAMKPNEKSPVSSASDEKVFITVYMILGNGVYKFCKCRTRFFLKDQIPSRVAGGGNVLIAAVSTAILPHMCSQLRWYYVLVIDVYASVLAFGNAYGDGQCQQSI
ncbi:unnamed protein product [Brassica rapa]|uniref:Uncharacterized protein n=1 Tax=Brassica campestris TaxID=3711 RepID=A0A3P5YV50_BRACM|nr:unnamed protein product [Brassica rapa]VDC67145.1 unnamed protein product [Brassica rapa]